MLQSISDFQSEIQQEAIKLQKRAYLTKFNKVNIKTIHFCPLLNTIRIQEKKIKKKFVIDKKIINPELSESGARNYFW